MESVCHQDGAYIESRTTYRIVVGKFKIATCKTKKEMVGRSLGGRL